MLLTQVSSSSLIWSTRALWHCHPPQSLFPFRAVRLIYRAVMITTALKGTSAALSLPRRLRSIRHPADSSGSVEVCPTFFCPTQWACCLPTEGGNGRGWGFVRLLVFGENRETCAYVTARCFCQVNHSWPTGSRTKAELQTSSWWVTAVDWGTSIDLGSHCV